MGESRTVGEFAKRIKNAATSTERNSPAILRAAAAEAKKVFLATSDAKGVHPGGKLAGKGWGVNYSFLSPHEALVRFTGPFHLVESNTKAHGEVPKNAQALHFGDNFAESVLHPGTKGKHIFSEAKQIVAAKVPKQMAAELHKVWVEALK